MREKTPVFFACLQDWKKQRKLDKGYQEKDSVQKDFHCVAVDMSSEVISMCVLRKIVRHQLSNRIVKTYVMLKTCSQASFPKENLLSDFGMQTRKM